MPVSDLPDSEGSLMLWVETCLKVDVYPAGRTNTVIRCHMALLSTTFPGTGTECVIVMIWRSQPLHLIPLRILIDTIAAMVIILDPCFDVGSAIDNMSTCSQRRILAGPNTRQ